MLVGVPVGRMRELEDEIVVILFERSHMEGLVHGPANTSVFRLPLLSLLLER